MVTGLCALPASFGAGYIWDHWGAVAPFSVSGVLTVVATLMLIFVREKKISKPLVINDGETVKF